jgi:hypothetical protein
MARARGAIAALLVLAAAGCGAGAGRLRIDQVGKPAATLLDAPARARYCASDSLLTVIAVGGTWAGGLALRVVLPLSRPDSFRIGRSLGGAGTATAALRERAGGARVATAGQVTLRAGWRLEGRFAFTATLGGGASQEFRGRMAGIRVEPAAEGACRR